MRPLSVVALLASLAAAAPVLPDPRERAVVARSLLHRTRFLSDRDAVAVAPDGTVHRVFSDLGQRLRHARLAGGLWRQEALDDRPSILKPRSAAFDAAGRLHALCVVDEGDAVFTVLHGVLDGDGWTETAISPGADPGTLALGPGDLPRVLFHTDFPGDVANLKVGVFDGIGWTVAPTGLRGRAVDLAVDAQGRAHAVVDTGIFEQYYATDASGSWAEVPLPHDMRTASLVLDAAGRPHLAATLASSGPPDALRHTWFDGAAWRTEEILPSGVPDRGRSDPILLTLPAGRLAVLFSEFDLSGGTASSRRLAYQDGSGWRAVTFAVTPYGARAGSAAVDPDGAIHAVFGSAVPAREESFRIALPDLRVDAAGLVATDLGNAVRVRGSVLVENLGAGRSKTADLRFFLSGDAAPLGRAYRIRPLRRGSSQRVPIRLRVPGPAAGRSVLAVVDAGGRLQDLDRPDNTAEVQLGE